MPASTPNAETAVQTYFHEVRAVHATGAGVAETSYYPALFGLLGSIGATLKPRVHAVNHLSNLGAGIPDGGFFDAGQLQRGQEQDVLRGQLPSRGALEVKSPAEQVADIATGTQVAKYLDLYGLVLVTNLRAFALYTRENGQPKLLEHMELAPNAAAFWTLLRDPDAQSAHAAPLAEFLTRALQTGAPLSTPESVAWFLASYAREAKHRLSHTPLEALAPLKRALSEALDLQFQDEQGERFFRSTLIQTLWYGLFSAWVLHSAQQPQLPFNWRAAAWELHLPVMQRLFGELANPSAQHSLNLTDLLDRTAATLARVDVTTFTQKFQGDAVQYFYEPFLAAYDPELRKQFGVWYTPPEVVQYMVERVDTALREQLNLPLGLADPSVYVLDPATGTGSYLTATLDRIWRTLKAQPDFDDATLDDLRAAVKERLIGFEIMPAPYVIAHLRLSQQLARYGVTLRPSDPAHPAKPERAAVYLTNALTNWHTIPEPLSMPELQAEQDAAQHVKKSAPILVILGNPLQRLQRHQPDRGRRPDRPLQARPRHRVGHPQIQPGRPVRPLLPHRRTQGRAGRARHRVLHQPLLVPERPQLRGHAQRPAERIQPPDLRQPERRQPRNRQTHPRRPARPQHLQHPQQPRRHPQRHRRIPARENRTGRRTRRAVPRILGRRQRHPTADRPARRRPRVLPRRAHTRQPLHLPPRRQQRRLPELAESGGTGRRSTDQRTDGKAGRRTGGV
ncbi:N-6 DNA methylase [Deinococcus aquaticus]|uniref:N-6 DNA methylase n=1 Tax=Deinococcus aquaticus TaxID=328692 RepID=UPI00360C39AD